MVADRSSFSTLDLYRPRQRRRRYAFALAIGAATAIVAYAFAMMVVNPDGIAISGDDVEFVYGWHFVYCVTGTAGIAALAVALAATRRR